MVIDGHAHSCGDFYDGEKLIGTLDKLGVDKVVLCPGQLNGPRNHMQPYLSGSLNKTELMFVMNRILRLVTSVFKDSMDLEENNEYVFRLKQKYPDRIYQFYWADPNADNVVEDLENKYELYEFKGIKLHQCLEDFSCDSSAMYGISRFAAAKNIPVFIHLYSRRDVKAFMALARANPGTNYIVGHLIGMEMLEVYSPELFNVYFDISPAPLISGYRMCRAVKAFGAERIIFGSDTPYGRDNLLNNLIKVKKLHIPEEEKALILGGNMRRLLKI